MISQNLPNALYTDVDVDVDIDPTTPLVIDFFVIVVWFWGVVGVVVFRSQ